MFEEILMFKDLGIAGVSIVIVYTFAKWTTDKALKQVEYANKILAETQQRFITFIETTYVDNTRAMVDISRLLKEDIRFKTETVDLLKNQFEDIKRERKYDR